MAGYRIKAVARLTGLSEAVLRTWERRYRVVTPRRTAGGYRDYSEEDVERLQRLRALTEAGRAISEIAPLSLQALRDQPVGDAAGAAPPGSHLALAPVHVGPRAADLLQATRDRDAAALLRGIAEALLLAPTQVALQDVLLPLARAALSSRGSARVDGLGVQLLAGTIRGFLGPMQAMGGPRAPEALLVQAAGCADAGTLVPTLALLKCGWGLAWPAPVADLVVAAELIRSRQPDAIVVVAGPATGPAALQAAWDGLGRLVGTAVRRVCYGPVAPELHPVLARMGVIVAVEEPALEAALA